MVTERTLEPRQDGIQVTYSRLSPERLCLISLLVYLFIVIGALLWYWGINPEHCDRVLILIGSAWSLSFLIRRWHNIAVYPRLSLGFPALIVGILSIITANYLLPQIGPRPLLLWWLTSSCIIIITGYVVSTYGLRRLRFILFPLVFLLFALPLPMRVLSPTHIFLQDITTSVSERVLIAIGQSVQREGFVLALPHGRLGVEEACSGVRSLTALTAIAAFVAFLKALRIIRSLLLVMLSIPVVVAVNIIRVIASGLIQEWIGREYIIGNWHEGLGFILVGVGLLLILALSRLLTHSKPLEDNNENQSVTQTPIVVRCHHLVTLLLGLGAGVTIILGTSGWIRIEDATEDVYIHEISKKHGLWNSEDLAVPEIVKDKLVPDQVVHRRYMNNIGHEAYVWVLYWSTASSLRGQREHNPDDCWGGRGYQPDRKWIESIQLSSGNELPVIAREYRFQKERQLVFYWTQENRHVLEEHEMQIRYSSSWYGHSWVGRLLGHRRDERFQRLAVVVIMPDSTSSSHKAATEITQLLANELYRICPWAEPGTHAE